MPVPIPFAPTAYKREDIQAILNVIEDRISNLESPASTPPTYAFGIDSAQVGDAYDETFPALSDVATALTNLLNVLKLRGII